MEQRKENHCDCWSAAIGLVLRAYHSRFNAQNVAHTPSLVPVCLVSLTDSVDVVDADNPLLLSELNLTDVVVHVADERAEDLTVAGFCLGAHEVDDVLSEVGVEFGLSLAGAVGVAIGRLLDAIGTVGGTVRADCRHIDVVVVVVI